ncbi:MAG: hypothetical protein CSA54_02405 [Gammaproteobacteria bacterium]|nr:MAG: hypothetical protein CSA54_02405 [Gammaproteobacteria bacterium]
MLHIPKRTVADTRSFPVDPDGVAEWLEALDPLERSADAHEVHRGLKHSNRLHNDVERRRKVISCFIPTLRALQRHLSEPSRTQPLPLNRDAARQSELAEALLREEAFAFSLLLSDSKAPVSDDARRAMQALARQTECILQCHRRLPGDVLTDAHALYLYAEDNDLLDTHEDPLQLSLKAHYQFILLAAISDTRQQRVHQLPALFELLRNAAARDIGLGTTPPPLPGPLDFAIDLGHVGRPIRARWFQQRDNTEHLRYFSIEKPLAYIERQAAALREHRADLLAPGRLERTTLKRLQQSLMPTRTRRSARRISRAQRLITFGLSEIGAEVSNGSQTALAGVVPGEGVEEHRIWREVNVGEHGLCLENLHALPASVQVGELVSINPATADGTAAAAPDGIPRRQALGTVRWIDIDGEAVRIGIELLARSVLPVTINRSDDRKSHGTRALVLACKVRNEVLQTILLPPYQFQMGDRLVASQGPRFREVSLQRPLQSTSQFSHFALG